MSTPTPEQQAVVENKGKARIRVVRSGPGSGKTWLVAEIIRQTLGAWPKETSGIAALSFTRVGGDEIRKAVGHNLDHPHFVGTIDAFLFRYVIRPHLRHVFNWFANPRLVIGEWGAEHWDRVSSNKATTIGQGINLFGCAYIGEEQGQEVIAHKPRKAYQLQPLTGNNLSLVRDAKKKIWAQHGLLTHSDAAFWAANVLADPTFGPVIRSEIIQRFPLLIVDELQDTGYFLGKSIRLLLEEPSATGVLVGDPDQAIYEFTGARPDLFESFETIAGAVTFPLVSSQRCPPAVVRAAMHLKDVKGAIVPNDEKKGRATLVRYNDMVEDTRKVIGAIYTNRSPKVVKVVVRGTTTIDALIGRRSGDAPALHCPPLRHICRAVVAFRHGRNTAALAAARAAVDRAVFDHEGVNDENLVTVGIDPRDWKKLAIQCLLKVNAIEETCTSFDWHSRAGEMLDQDIDSFGLPSTLGFAIGRLKPQRREGWDSPATDFLPHGNTDIQALLGVPVRTVHGVKGETHDVTIFVCPHPDQKARCPSILWWEVNDKAREEKRIAYVAMTRSQGDLVVCVSDETYQRLRTNRVEFVESFECMTADEYAKT
jgi:DNA helicase-2/ATP-dependent DNA helicase PcrA